MPEFIICPVLHEAKAVSALLIAPVSVAKRREAISVSDGAPQQRGYLSDGAPQQRGYRICSIRRAARLLKVSAR